MSLKTIFPFIRFVTLFTGVRHVCALTSYAKMKNFVLIPICIDDENHDEGSDDEGDRRIAVSSIEQFQLYTSLKIIRTLQNL